MNHLHKAAFYGLAMVASSCVAQSGAAPVPAEPVIVTRFAIDGADSLSASQIEVVKSAVLRKPKSAEALMDTARQLITSFLDNSCYIRSDIQLSVVNAATPRDNAWMQATVQQGIRYRLRNFKVNWATVFSEQEIKQHLHLDAMRQGDCSALDGVERTVTGLYQRRGFRNVKVHSLVQANRATQQFDLTLYINEGI